MRSAWKFLRTLAPRICPLTSRNGLPNLQVRPSLSNSIFSFPFPGLHSSGNSRFYSLLYEPGKDPAPVLVAGILSKPIGHGEIKAELDSLNLTLDQETIDSVLHKLGESPEIAAMFFDWVLSKETPKNRLLRSKSYNLMAEIVSRKGKVENFWGLIEAMKKRGYRISKESFLKASERFKSEKMERDLGLLNELYSMNSPRDVSGRICRILRKGGEPEAIWQALEDSGISLSADSLVAVLHRIGSDPKKALAFFRWVEKSSSVEIDRRIYNAMAMVLGREDCIDDFWAVLHKMRSSGFGLDRETYFMVSNRFRNQKKISTVVDLYEFAMASSEKPPVEDFVILLKKVAASKDLDTTLVTKVVKIFTSAGNSVKVSTFDRVLKSLRNVGRLGECVVILKAMEEGGFKRDATVDDRVVSSLCDTGKLDEALQYINNLESSAGSLGLNGWRSVVETLSLAGQLDKAIACFHKMVERNCGENVDSIMELLVTGLCSRKSALDACKLLRDSVTKKNVKPRHATYKLLIERLISQGHLKEASGLFGLMKSHGFPPFIEPFIDYVAKSGTANDAALFLKAMTEKESPSRAVYVRLIEALFKAKRVEVAHDVLSLALGSVRNHADVLDLFYLMKPDSVSTVAA